MGFLREPPTFNMSWPEGSELHGLHVKARSIPFGQYLDVQARATRVDIAMKADDASDDLLADMTQLTRDFASVLVEWDLETPGPDGPIPVPATVEGLHSQDSTLVLMLIWSWLNSVTDIPATEDDDLGKDSTSGDPSLEVSLPMEPLSPSPQNSDVAA